MQNNNQTPDDDTLPTLVSAGDRPFFSLKSFPLIDVQSGLKNMNADQSLFITILSILIEQEFPNERNAYAESHAQSDWEGIEKLAHKMKGGAMYTGLLRLQHACQFFETYHLSGQTALLEALYQQIIHTLDDTQQAIENVIKDQTHP